MSVIKKINQSLVKYQTTLEDKKQNIQKYLDDRKGSLVNWSAEILDGVKINASDIYTQDTNNVFNGLVDQYKTRIDPQKIPPKTFDPNFDGGSVLKVITNDEYFSQLPVADIWNSTLRAKSLNGLLGSKKPLLPMVFQIQLPPSATNNNPVPDLTLFVNPSSWARSVNKVQQNIWTRNGIKTERWGDDLEQISASGSLGGFYTIQTGLTRLQRWQTPTYRNLMELVQIYKNNGCTYGKTYTERKDFVAPSRNRILDVGQVAISYGYDVFIGNFESFEITEDENSPFTIKYSFVFNCSQVVSIHDLNPQSTRLMSQQDQGSSIQTGQGFSLRGDYNDNRNSQFSAVQAAMKAAGEEVPREQNPLFTLPNPTVSETPKDTLFPSLVSGIGKQDATKAVIVEAAGSKNFRGALKVDFRDAEEAKKFYAGLPTDQSKQAAYIAEFIERQKNRSNA
jgi:hypothetical protein